MGIADRIRTIVQGVASESTTRAKTVADARRRGKLISELGDLSYRRDQGEAINDAQIRAVIARIEELDTDAGERQQADLSGEGGEDYAAGAAEVEESDNGGEQQEA